MVKQDEIISFPISAFDFWQGTVVEVNEDTGEVHVIDDEGQRWRGYDYQLERGV